MKVFAGILAAVGVVAAVAVALVDVGPPAPPAPLCPGPLCPSPMPPPMPPAPPVPKPRPGPWDPRTAPVGAPVETPTEGGPTAPDGHTEVATDLPVSLRLKNVGGRDGAGLCVFTSINHSARYQNEQALWNFQQQMKSEAGGGYPSKVDSMIKKYAPNVQYLQYEGPDAAILEAALKSGRMPAVTYDGYDCHYRGSVSHMVNLVYLDQGQAAILDNNFIGDTQLVWMSRAEFIQRWTSGGRSGWCVVLLAPAPAPVPHL